MATKGNRKAAKKPTKKPTKKGTKKATKKATKKGTKKPAKKATKQAKPRELLPTAEEETRFWSLIEDAWATQSAEVNAARKALAARDEDDDPELEAIDAALEGVLASLRAAFANEDFPQEELVAMDRVLERKLYNIDRQEIQEVTDGSDDGFLYARGFIVALGKAFYDAVDANPAVAICDAECEEMCYLPAHVHEERFGDWPKTGANISRESCSNRAGWDD
jgi:hypothetical protein